MRAQDILLLLVGIGGSYAMNFTKTCTTLGLEGHMLFAKCQKLNHSDRAAPLDLNTCLGYKDGIIQRGENAIGNSACSFCALDKAWLQCMCYQGGGIIAPSAPFNLDNIISNHDGELHCDA
ncbi:hypothetical protein BDV29DRAFT_43777 [Aspergillus leporis]|uniref:Cyanovirin-N domain-containing protein n=1 Tax=Aspergillus leporis TaxID=41062 RepID=A0A5N5WRN1_9EURO|nr:hypothetical protein BDV29DRAFT_43777 [Aspergillus leporis]